MQHLILLHGAIGAADQLESLKDLLKKDFEVHLFNFSGHGGKPFPSENFSIASFSNEVLAYLDQNRIQSAHFFGYSMGGYVAMHLAKDQPSRVNKIVTLATKFQWDQEIAEREVKMLDAEKISEKLPAFAEQLRQRHAPNDWKIVLQKTIEMLIGLGNQNALQLKDYASISNQCLLLVGEKDKMVTQEETVEVYKALPNAKLMTIPDTSHSIEHVDVLMLAGIINEFLG